MSAMGGDSGATRSHPPWRRVVVIAAAVVFLGTAVLAIITPAPAGPAGALSSSLTPPSVRSPLVGAYYSDWFPSNSAQGTLRQHLVPAQGADPSKVDSADPAVAEQAISQATGNGINFFALDYWPSRPAQNENIDAFLRADNIRDIKFCILYETWDLGFDAAHESTPIDPGMEFSFAANLLSFARTYFRNPSYLRIHGRPVLVLYLTRTLTGDVAGMIDGARRLLEAHGYDPYIIGDEIYWRVTSTDPPATGSWLTLTPQRSRLELFDAITSYSLYVGDSNEPFSPWKDFVGYPGDTHIVADEEHLYEAYASASGGKVPVIPDVQPGVNTRGVRLSVNEPAEPRQWLPGQSSGSTMQNFLDQIAAPIIEPSLPMMFVTSWNEWNEDTAVQPVGGTPTSRDNSPTGTEYTQGYTYGGEGGSALTAIRNFVGVAWGEVLSATGRPLAHVEVTALRGGKPVSTTRTDAEGRYVLRRTSDTIGLLTIESHGGKARLMASGAIAVLADIRT
jgi:glycoprotein endo-alpha-1,2-mannosidase